MNVHQQWLNRLEELKLHFQSEGVNLQLPPPSMDELRVEYLEIIPGKKIRGKVPFQARFTNPIRTYQGGFLSAVLDEHFGPLSYMTADRPCTTLSLNVTFLRAFTEEMKHCFVEAEVLSKTKSFIFMRAIIRSENDEILAHADSHVSILRDDQLGKMKV